MQAVEGSGTQAATTSGGSGNIGVAPDGGRNAYGVTTADNVNPQAPDCYFYYYSNCAKGSQCKFRHCSAALGTEEACDLWLNGGECRRQVCAFRHSMSERQRNAIPCYWEGQPVGCLKPHCPFLHAKPRPKTPSVFDRLDQFKTTDEETKFASLKVKSLDEIREEKQLASSNVAPPQPQSTTYTWSHPHTMSYNRTYTPAQSTHPPSSTPTQTSFKLTSVLQTTGLSRNQTNSKPSSQLGAAKRPVVTAAMNQVRLNPVSQSVAVGGVSKTTTRLHLNQDKLSYGVKSAQVGGNVTMRARAPPRAKEGVATMIVQKTSTSLFGSQSNPSSVFSPNYQPGQNLKETKTEKVERDPGGLFTETKSGERDGGFVKSENDESRSVSAIMWGDEGEGGGGGGGGGEGGQRKGSRVVRMDPMTMREAGVPVAKKVKVATCPLGPPSARVPPTLVSVTQSQPKATSSPIRLPEKEKGVSVVTGKVGVAIGGRGQTGRVFGDFHVKSLEEIRAEKRKRQGGNGEEKSAQLGTEKTEGSTPPMATVKPQPAEKKIVKIKKRVASAQEQGMEKEENTKRGGDREVGEGGGSEEGRGERDGDRKNVEQYSSEGIGKKTGLEVDKISGKIPEPAGKRRKLSRTPLSVVQATPATDTHPLTISTVAVVPPQVTTDDQAQPDQAKLDPQTQESDDSESMSPSASVGSSASKPTGEERKETERESLEASTAAQLGSIEREREVNAKVVVAERKMSISEMKAQIQSELRDRSDSEMLSYDQLESELAQWEEELGEEGEGEGGGDDELLDSKTDDDLMLEFAEFL